MRRLARVARIAPRQAGEALGSSLFDSASVLWRPDLLLLIRSLETSRKAPFLALDPFREI